jgi:hypothetical protein
VQQQLRADDDFDGAQAQLRRLVEEQAALAPPIVTSAPGPPRK